MQVSRISLATSSEQELVVHPVRRNKPWKVDLLSSRSWPGHLFVESHSCRRVGLWCCGRIQVPASVSEGFVDSGRWFLWRLQAAGRNIWRMVWSVRVKGPISEDTGGRSRSGEVTPDRTGRTQRLTGRKGFGSGLVSRSENSDSGLLKAGKHLWQHGRVLGEMRREQTRQICSELSANHWSGTWPCNKPVLCIHVCLESLIRGPALGFFSITGRAACDRADLGRGRRWEVELAGREKRTSGCTGRRRRNGRGEETAAGSFGTEGFAHVFVCLAFASRSRM